MGNGNRVEMFIALCALISSMMAIYIAWDQGRVMRAQQHGAVYPVLQVDGYARNNTDTSSVGISIRNSGVGPALIESVALLVDGEPVPGFREYAQGLPAGYELSWSGVTGRALAAGETITPVDISWPIGEFSIEALQKVALDTQRWSLHICYCSVFERCWETFEIGRSRASRVDSCPRDEVDIFEDVGNWDLMRKNTVVEMPAGSDANSTTNPGPTP